MYPSSTPARVLSLFVLIASLSNLPIRAGGGGLGPSLHPAHTRVFPQAVIGQFGDLTFELEVRVSNTSPLRSFEGQALLWPRGISVSGGIDCPLTLTDLFTGQEFEIVANGAEGTDLFLGLDYPALFTDAYTLTADTADSRCRSFIGALSYQRLLPVLADEPSGGVQGALGAAIEDLAFSFFYNIRDLQGNLVDKVAVAPAQAGRGFQFVTARSNVLDIGIAVFVTAPMSLSIEIDFGPGGGPPLNTTTEVIEGQDAFFLDSVFKELPDDIPGAIVTVAAVPSKLGGEVYGVTVGQQIEDVNLQFAPQPIKLLPLFEF